MSGAKAPDFDAYGLLRATHSHNPTRYEHKSGMIIPRYANIGWIVGVRSTEQSVGIKVGGF